MSIVECSKCKQKNRIDPLAAATHLAKCGKCGAPLEIHMSATEAGDGEPIVVSDSTLQQALANAGDKPFLLDAWAPWCGPCRMVGPIMDQLAKESSGRYLVGKLNVDDNPQTASRFQISSIPTLLIFKNGQLIDRIIGAQPKSAIEARLAKAA
jgi:thioredoxin